jgi:hypothetical protein
MERMRLARELFAPKNYFAVLAAVLIASFVGPLLNNSWEGRVAGSAFIFLLVVSVSYAVSPSRIFICASTILGVPGLDAPAIKAGSYFLGFVFLVLGTCVIFRDVFTGAVTANRLCGAICLYLLIGACFAILYMVVDIADPKAFQTNEALASRFDPNNPRHERLSLLMYFSMVTLSTAGYGDISPVNRLARTLAWLEAASGQIYLSMMVARLVGLHIVGAQAAAAARRDVVGD